MPARRPILVISLGAAVVVALDIAVLVPSGFARGLTEATPSVERDSHRSRRDRELKVIKQISSLIDQPPHVAQLDIDLEALQFPRVGRSSVVEGCMSFVHWEGKRAIDGDRLIPSSVSFPRLAR